MRQFVGSLTAVRSIRAKVVELIHAKFWPCEVVFGRVHLDRHDVGPEIGRIISLEGWAFSRSDVFNVEVWLGETLLGRAQHGFGRPDLAQLYPNISKAKTSGLNFKAKIPSGLEDETQWKVVGRTQHGACRIWRGNLRISESRLQLCRPVRLAPNISETHSKSHQTLVLLTGSARDGAAEFERAKDSVGDYGRCSDLLPDLDMMQIIETFRSRLAADPGLFYISMLSTGDQLAPNALEILIHSAANQPNAFIFADEACETADRRTYANFKPAWSPRLLQDHNYIGRPWICARDIFLSAEAAGDLESCKDEADFVRRLTNHSEIIIHVAEVLCQRSNPSSERQQPRPRVAPTDVSVAVIIPTCLAEPSMTRACVESVQRHQSHATIKIILMVNNCDNYQKIIEQENIKADAIYYYDGAFNWSKINNISAKNSAEELFLFLNDDAEFISDFSIDNLVAEFADPSVGVVGAQLLYADRTVQHLGVGQVDAYECVRHLFQYWPPDLVQGHRIARATREVAAVTGACLMTTRKCFEHLGGFDESFPLVYNDIDFCFRAQEAGYRVLIAPDKPILHHESISRAGMTETADTERFRAKWRERLARLDLYGNPNLDALAADWAQGSTSETGEGRIRMVRNRSSLIPSQGLRADAH